MSNAAPDSIVGGGAPAPYSRRIIVTAALSAALHLLLIGLFLLPPRQAEPAEPPPINVDLIPPDQMPSSEPPSSSEAPSSEPASSEAPSSEAPSSAEPASSAEPSSAEPVSSQPASASEASSAPPPSASEAASSAEPPPTPQARPIVLPVGPSEEASTEASSQADQSASEEVSSAEASSAPDSSPSALTTTDAGAADAIGETSSSAPTEPDDDSASTEPPPITGALHTAKRFYLDAILSSAQMAKARDAIKKLPPERRLAQTCNIEAVGQLGGSGRGFSPDAVIADAFAKPVIDGSRFSVSAGAFRSQGKWYAVAYTCTLSKDLSAVQSFSYRIGGDVTAQLKGRLGG